MRDAESMLDQLLSAAPERIDEANVRDLLGLADAEVVTAFIDAPRQRGRRRTGSPCSMRSRSGAGTSARLLDQAVEAIRAD